MNSEVHVFHVVVYVFGLAVYGWSEYLQMHYAWVLFLMRPAGKSVAFKIPFSDLNVCRYIRKGNKNGCVRSLNLCVEILEVLPIVITTTPTNCLNLENRFCHGECCGRTSTITVATLNGIPYRNVGKNPVDYVPF
jgi:hypothetical protein